MSKTCLVHLNERGDPIRIIKTAKLARLLPVEEVAEWPRADAIRSIRWQIYQRSKNEEGQSECEWCGRYLTQETGHMHETIFRSQRDSNGNKGEVSLANSVFICSDCHLGPNGAHKERRWHSAKIAKEQ